MRIKITMLNKILKIIMFIAIINIIVIGTHIYKLKAEDNKVIKLTKLMAFTICLNYSNYINEEQYKTDKFEFIESMQDRYNKINYYDNTYYIKYNLLINSRIVKVECKVNEYYIMGVGSNIIYHNEDSHTNYTNDIKDIYIEDKEQREALLIIEKDLKNGF